MICTQCNKDLPETLFYKRSKPKNGYRQPCKVCQRKTALERYHQSKAEDSATLSIAESLRTEGETIADAMDRGGLRVQWWHRGIAQPRA